MFLALMLVFVAAPSTAASNESITVINPKTSKEFTFANIAVMNLILLKEVLVELDMLQHLETLQGIMLVETRAGTGGSVGLPKAHWTRRSYGLMQITVPTAQVILRDNPEILQRYFGKRSWKSISLEEMRAFLIREKRANIHMGAVLFKLYLDMTGNEWARAVAGYNMGIGNALKRKEAPKVKYVRDVREMQKVAALLNHQLATVETVDVQPVTQISVTHPIDVDNFASLQDSQSTIPIKENNNGKREESVDQNDQNDQAY